MIQLSVSRPIFTVLSYPSPHQSLTPIYKQEAKNSVLPRTSPGKDWDSITLLFWKEKRSINFIVVSKHVNSSVVLEHKSCIWNETVGTAPANSWCTELWFGFICHILNFNPLLLSEWFVGTLSMVEPEDWTWMVSRGGMLRFFKVFILVFAWKDWVLIT